MNIGKLNQQVTIQTLIVADDGTGHFTESWSEAETVRANVNEMDGSRLVNQDELKDRKFFSIECWDHNYDNNIMVKIGDYETYPIRPITKNPNYGRSNLVEIKIYTATKAGAILQA